MSLSAAKAFDEREMLFSFIEITENLAIIVPNVATIERGVCDDEYT